MGETKRESRTFRISRTGVILIAAVLLAALAAAVYVVPRYGAVFAEYKEKRGVYKAAAADLDAAKSANEELNARLENLKAITADCDAAKKDALAAAARLEKDIKDGKSDKKICYITVDDGPYKRGSKYLELFDKYDIKATFFFTTANGNKLPDQGDIKASTVYPEYLMHGHTIGNHTYSHNYKTGGIYSSPEAFMKSVNKQQEFTKKATGGYVPEIVRFPGGSSTAGSMLGEIEKELAKAGLGYIDWTVDSGDSWGSKSSAKSIKKTVLKAAEKQDIMVVLFHEWSQDSLDALPEIIESLQEQGYIFLPLFKDSIMVN